MVLNMYLELISEIFLFINAPSTPNFVTNDKGSTLTTNPTTSGVKVTKNKILVFVIFPMVAFFF